MIITLTEYINKNKEKALELATKTWSFESRFNSREHISNLALKMMDTIKEDLDTSMDESDAYLESAYLALEEWRDISYSPDRFCSQVFRQLDINLSELEKKIYEVNQELLEALVDSKRFTAWAKLNRSYADSRYLSDLSTLDLVTADARRKYTIKQEEKALDCEKFATKYYLKFLNLEQELAKLLKEV